MIEVRIQILSFWHPGTGKGQGPGADAEANRDSAGLPVVPGRTLKGLMREAAEVAAHLGRARDEDITELFGSPFLDDSPSDEPARHRSVPGRVHFGSARLGRTVAEADAWQSWATSDASDGPKRQLFRTIASTKLENGVAADHTLRSIEVVVPVQLSAKIEAPPADEIRALNLLQAAAPFVNAVGAHRSRGLGRCVVTVVRGGQ